MQTKAFRARLAARILLNDIWFGSDNDDPGTFLLQALDAAANRLRLEVKRVHSILGDNQIAGVMERLPRRIQVATKFNYTSQRFTCAHEIGHFVLHPQAIYFRDRELSSPGSHQEYYEIEADAFAAEFLMPRKYLDSIFERIFGGPIDPAVPDPKLMLSVRDAEHSEVTFTPDELSVMDPFARAMAVAVAHSCRGQFFNPLTKQFNVSRKAMAIQLLQMSLVK